MNFCARHARLLEDAILLRGLEPDAVAGAQQAIVTHATNFAGRAAVDMLTRKACPICFVNGNPAGVNCDGWVDNAADEAVEADIVRRDRCGADGQRLVVI